MNNNLDYVNKLFNMDCIKGMKTFIPDKSVDLILTDLPYSQTKLDWDLPLNLESLWKEFKRVRKDNTAICLFGQESFSSHLRLSNLGEYKYDIYWIKERITNIFQVKRRPGKVVETISVFYKKQPTYNPQLIKYLGKKRSNKIKDGKLGFLVDSGGRKPLKYEDSGLRYPTQVVSFKRDILTNNLHPTQKPIALLEYLIKTFSNEGDLVLDATFGSGSTMIASINTDRNYVGFELNPDYFKIAQTRIKNIKETDRDEDI